MCINHLQFRLLYVIVEKSIFSTEQIINLYFYSKFQKIHALNPINHCKSRRIWNGSPVLAVSFIQKVCRVSARRTPMSVTKTNETNQNKNHVQRNYKDTVFRMLFREKENLLSLLYVTSVLQNRIKDENLYSKSLINFHVENSHV